MAIFAHRLGTGHPDTAASLHQLGLVLHTQGQSTEAQGYVAQALAIYQQAVGVDHPNTQRVRASLAAMGNTTGHANPRITSWSNSSNNTSKC